MKWLLNQFLSQQFLRFLMVGGTAALVNFGSRILYQEYLPFSSAVIVAYLTGMVAAFFPNRALVFTNGDAAVSTQASYFFLVNAFGMLQTWILSVGLANYIFADFNVAITATLSVSKYSVAHAIGIVFPVFTSFLGHKYFSFAARKP